MPQVPSLEPVTRTKFGQKGPCEQTPALVPLRQEHPHQRQLRQRRWLPPGLPMELVQSRCGRSEQKTWTPSRLQSEDPGGQQQSYRRTTTQSKRSGPQLTLDIGLRYNPNGQRSIGQRTRDSPSNIHTAVVSSEREQQPALRGGV